VKRGYLPEISCGCGPEVLDTIKDWNISNYSIYLKDVILFGYFEHHGTDLESDWAKMAADPRTQEWWAVRATGGRRWKSCFIWIELPIGWFWRGFLEDI
jgi:hypothetical protein